MTSDLADRGGGLSTAGSCLCLELAGLLLFIYELVWLKDFARGTSPAPPLPRPTPARGCRSYAANAVVSVVRRSGPEF